MKKQKPTSYAFALQTVLISVVLLVVCTLLLQVFAGAIKISREAEQVNRGTQLCRNAAEAFAAAESPKQLAELLEGTQQQNQVCVQYSDGYQLTVTIREEEQQTGQMEFAHISVQTDTGTVCMELDTQTYRTSVLAGGGDYAQ